MMTGTMQLPSGTVPQFGFLHDIIIFGTSQTVVFIFEEYETIGYSPHFGAYETSYNPERPQYLCIYRLVLKCHNSSMLFMLTIVFSLSQSMTSWFTVTMTDFKNELS